MAEIDTNGLILEVSLDNEGIQRDADKMQKTLEDAIGAIDAKAQSMQKSFSQAMAEIAYLPDQFAKGMSEVLRQRDDEKARKADEERQKQAERQRIIDFDRQRKQQLTAQKEQVTQIVSGFRSMAIAAGAVVTAGMGIKQALNFTNDLARSDLAIKSFGMNAEQFFKIRNMMREGGIGDGETFAMEDNMSNIFRTARERGGIGLLNENQQMAMNYLSRYNRNIDPSIATNDDGTRMNFSQWQRETMLSMGRFFNDPSIHLSEAMRTELMAPLTGNKLTAQLIAQTSPEEINKTDERAKREAESLRRNIENNKKVQELRSTLETNIADLLAKMSPEIISIFDAINQFAQNPENVRLLAQGLRDLGSVIKQLLNRVLHFVEWLGIKVPKNLYELTGEKPQLNVDSIPKQRLDELKEASARQGIEIYDYSGKMWATDKRNNTVPLIDPDESIESIKRRLDDKQKQKDRLPLVGPDFSRHTRGFELIPSAHAGDLSHNLLLDASKGGRMSGKGWSHAKVSDATMEHISKLLRDGYKSEGMEDFKADIAIANVNRESGFDIHAEGDHGKSKGLFQFDSYRQGLFAQRYGHPIEQGTAEEQVDFHFWELKNNEKRAGNRLRRARTVAEANRVSIEDYERSKDQQSDMQKNLNFLPKARRLGRNRNVNSLPPTHQQMQTQLQAQKIINSRMITSGDTNYNVNINVKDGNPQHIANAFEQKVHDIKQKRKSDIQYPNIDWMNNWSPIT